jgi:hypothetical protein
VALYGDRIARHLERHGEPPVSATAIIRRSRERRNAGAPDFVATSLSGCLLWLRASLGVTTGATFTWADQSGTGDANKNMSSTGSAMPTVTASNAAYGHRATVDFSSVQSLSSGTWATALSQPFTEFIVGHTNTSGAGFFVDNSADTCSILYNAGIIIGAATQIVLAGTWSAPSVLGGQFDGATSAIYFNSHTASASGPVGSNGRTKEILGGFGPAPTIDPLVGSIAERIIYGRILSGAEFATAMRGLGAFYTLAIS